MYTLKKSLKIFIHMSLIGFITAGVAACHHGGGGGGDDTPGVRAVSPTNGAIDIEKTTEVTATFSAGMDDLTSVIASEFTLGDSAGNTVSGSATFDPITNVATFTPSANLGVLRTYTATLGTGITHSGGTPITQYNWSFTTREGAWSNAEKIEFDDFTMMSDPHVALAGNGDAIAIWISGTNDVYANKYSASTSSWSTAELISNLNFPKSDLQVAMDNSGNAIAVWSNAQGGNTNLRSAFYNGTSWAAAISIEGNGGVADNAQIAFDASGNAIVVWLQANDIWFNRYDAVGMAWDGEQTIETGAGVAFAPQLAVDDSGNAIAVWAQDNGGTNLIYANLFSATGGTWSGETAIGSGANGYIPQIAVDNDGNAIAIWLEDASPSPYSVWINRYSGDAWGTATEMENGVNVSAKPQIGIDAQGNGIAVWKDDTNGRLRYNAYSFDTGWGTAANLENGTNNTFIPQLAVDTEGHAIAVWRQYSDSTIISSVWTSRYVSGTGWGTPMMLEEDDTAPISSPDVAFDKNGNAFAIWIQDQGLGVDSTWTARFE